VGAQTTEGSRKKIYQMGLSLQNILRYTDKGEDMLNRIVTGDESWVHNYHPKSKCTSMQWKHPRSPSTKKLRHQSKDFCAAGFGTLVEQWDKCINIGGGYVEKCFFQV
jgi:hypothetical protein